MIRRRPFQRQPQGPKVVANHLIHCDTVRVLNEFGEMVGVLSTREALTKAREEGKDLVLVTENAKPPIVKIIALSKYRYQLQQKIAEGRKKNKKQEIKEIRFTPFIGEADFQVRLKRIIEFLKHGDKVRLSLEYRGRSITKQEFGRHIFDRVFQDTETLSVIEMPPKMLGKKMIAQIMPGKRSKKQVAEGVAMTAAIAAGAAQPTTATMEQRSEAPAPTEPEQVETGKPETTQVSPPTT